MTRREEVDFYLVPVVNKPVLKSGNAQKRACYIRREEFQRFQNIRDDNVHIQREPGIAVLLNRESAHDQMRNVIVRQYGRRCAGSLLQPGRPGVLPQQIGVVILHSVNHRTSGRSPQLHITTSVPTPWSVKISSNTECAIRPSTI